ncbi:MAG: HEAT repeat domain-containing protein [Terriglobia bacterium]
MKPCFQSLLNFAIVTLFISGHLAYGQQAPASAQTPANSQQVPAAAAGQPASARPAPDAPAQAAPQGPPITVTDGRVTVQAQNVSVRWLVNEIARQARIAVQMDPQVSDQKVNVDFQGYPVEAAVHYLLKEYDTFYYFGVYEEPPARLQMVWVYPKGQGSTLEPVPPEQRASTKELKEKFSSEDPAQRAKAIEQLIERLVDEAHDDVVKALRDPDDRVRTTALYKAQEVGVDLPTSVLADLALSDRSSNVRFLALEGISGNRDLQWIVERALSDPNQFIQARAREILTAWERARRPANSAPKTQQEIQQDASNAPTPP